MAGMGGRETGPPGYRGYVRRDRREYATAGIWAREELLRSRASIASASAAHLRRAQGALSGGYCAVAARAKRLQRVVLSPGARRARLGARRARLGARRARLGAKCAKLGARRSRLEATPAKLGARRARLGVTHSRLGVRHSRLGVTHSRLGVTQTGSADGAGTAHPRRSRPGLPRARLRAQGPRLQRVAPGLEYHGPGLAYVDPSQGRVDPGQERVGRGQVCGI